MQSNDLRLQGMEPPPRDPTMPFFAHRSTNGRRGRGYNKGRNGYGNQFNSRGRGFIPYGQNHRYPQHRPYRPPAQFHRNHLNSEQV